MPNDDCELVLFTRPNYGAAARCHVKECLWTGTPQWRETHGLARTAAQDEWKDHNNLVHYEKS